MKKTEFGGGVSCWHLRDACYKLRAIEYLLKNQRESENAIAPKPGVWYGLALVVGEIHDHISEFASRAEEEELALPKKRRRTSPSKSR